MSNFLRVRLLLVEDSLHDAELIVRTLQRDGFALEWERVYTREDFARALEAEWDLVLSDYSLAGFTAPDALEILRAQGADIPFVIVSGSVGEVVAVDAMRAGAHDFVSKDNLRRLGSVIRREVQEARFRRDRNEAFEKLRRAEERYRLIVESVKDYAIVMLDTKGRVASWNFGAERMLGYAENEALGQPHAIFFTSEDQAAGRPEAALNAALFADRDFDEEGWRVRKDGSRFWAESSLSIIREGSKLVGFSKVIRDISERKRLLDDLRLAVRARDEFLSIASHELKTPLTSLKLQVQSLQRLTKRDEEIALSSPKVVDKITVMERQTDRLTTLINNLLDVTRITSGKMVLVHERVDLAEIVNDVIERSQDAIRHSGSVLHLDVKSAIGQWDRLRVDAVVANLFMNALKYGEGQPICISTSHDKDVARLVIRDEGIGIAQAEQQRIFRRFERAVPEEHYGGFGLGLWIAGQVVDAHGGSIAVSSETAKGSTFTVELPLRPSTQAQGEPVR